MPRFSKGDVVLVRYPFTDLSGHKVRLAVVVSGPHESTDIVFIPVTSRVAGLRTGEFVLADYRGAGLNVPSAVKRGFHTLEERFVLQHVGRLSPVDRQQVDTAIASWLGLKLAP